MSNSFFLAIAKYQTYRVLAYQHAMKFVHANDPMGRAIGFGPLDQAAILAWLNHKTNIHGPHQTAFDWQLLDQDFSPYINRFELAIWCNQTICGLAIGRPSKGKTNLTIHFLERSYGPNPLAGRVAMLAFQAADAYGKVIGSQRVRIKNPVAGAIPHYKRLGFTIAPRLGGNVYMERAVT